MTRYLFFSAVIHGAALALLFTAPFRPKSKRNFYAVDFLGGQSGLGPGRLEPAPAPAGGAAGARPEIPEMETPPDTTSKDPKKIAVKKETPKPGPKDASKKKGKEGTPKAPRDRGMKGGRGESADGKGDIQGSPAGAVGGAGTALEIGGFGPGGGGKTNAHFPYGWYVNTLYKRLWEAWNRTDAGTRECAVFFTILKDGAVKDIKIDESSGDGFFDLTARRAVENAAPFPPLPEGFPDPTLPVFVRFRLQ